MESTQRWPLLLLVAWNQVLSLVGSSSFVCTGVDCHVLDWGDWSKCDPNTPSITIRTRSIVQLIDCQPAFPRNHHFASQCGPFGIKTRVHRIVVPAQCQGVNCPEVYQQKLCVGAQCQVSSVGEWSACDAHGMRQRSTKLVVRDGNGVEYPCTTRTDWEQCAPVDCLVSDWSPWTICDEIGWRYHSRTMTTAPRFGGKACPLLTGSDKCAPIDCQVSAWSAWSTCSVDGVQTRSRTVTVAPKYGGNLCPALVEEQQCPVYCQVSEWSQWSACTSDGVQTHTRTVTLAAKNGGTACPILSEERTCPVDCQVSEWTAWSLCDANGWTTHSRTVIQQNHNHGQPCPVRSETKACGTPVDCVLTDWETSTVCPNDYHKVTRVRSVVTEPQYGGLPCPSPLIEDQPCDDQCTYGPWQALGGCSAFGFGGFVGRGSAGCNLLYSWRQNCNPVDCVLGDWQMISDCTQGVATIARVVAVNAQFRGKPCPYVPPETRLC